MQITPEQLADEAGALALELRFAHRLISQQAAEIVQLRSQLAERAELEQDA